MILNCPNKKCNYSWDYNGDAPYYTSCPRCKSSVRVNQNNNKEGDND
ncbi:MAG: hypothetical protein AABY22_27470 [Nanoarchaeota archaeon]